MWKEKRLQKGQKISWGINGSQRENKGKCQKLILAKEDKSSKQVEEVDTGEK